jgi:hypothetical protein
MAGARSRNRPLRTGREPTHARSGPCAAGLYFRWLVGFGVADVSGDTAGFTGVTFDHVAAIATMAASRATKIPMRTRRFMTGL